MSIRFARPYGMRAVHQRAPAVETIDTRSPSRVPFSRNAATAALAWLARIGVMCVSSKMIANVRPRCSSGSVLTVTRGGSGGAGVGFRGSVIASKLVTCCGTPSSVTVRSLAS